MPFGSPFDLGVGVDFPFFFFTFGGAPFPVSGVPDGAIDDCVLLVVLPIVVSDSIVSVVVDIGSPADGDDAWDVEGADEDVNDDEDVCDFGEVEDLGDIGDFGEVEDLGAVEDVEDA